MKYSDNEHSRIRRDEFELKASRFVSETVRSTPQRLQSLVFAAPLSTRCTDLNLLWHTGYRNNHRLRLLIYTFWSFGISIVKGCRRVIPRFRCYGFSLYGRISNSVLVVPSTCGHETLTGEYKTSYVETETDDCIFTFGLLNNLGKTGKKFQFRFVKDIILPLFTLTGSGICAFSRVNGPLYERVLFLLQWTSWIISLEWLQYYCLELMLSDIVSKHRITKVGCIHEMHPHSRIVWRVAKKFQAKSYTVQHAAITLGKRWYFTYPEERSSGLVLPDVFYVFEDHVAKLLIDYYPKTKFKLGCSCRYAHWVNDHSSQPGLPQYYLFATALPQFDNRMIIVAIRRLLEEYGSNLAIRLRLHPAARLGFTLSNWVRFKVKAGIITLSNGGSLSDELSKAIVVIGMGSTVLQEALLMSRPVIQLSHPDYLEYVDINGISGAAKLDLESFSLDALQAVARQKVDCNEARRRLGMVNPLITFRSLFDSTLHSQSGTLGASQAVSVTETPAL